VGNAREARFEKSSIFSFMNVSYGNTLFLTREMTHGLDAVHLSLVTSLPPQTIGWRRLAHMVSRKFCIRHFHPPPHARSLA